MRHPIITLLLWLLALVVTLGLAVFQRLTGPTYPLRGAIDVGSLGPISYRLLRSHGGADDMPIRIDVGDADLRGSVYWRRYPTEDEWQMLEMAREETTWVAAIPHQPPAGKVEYRLVLETPSGEQVSIPGEEAVVARFKGSVPAAVLIPHVIAMFSSMLFATYAFFEVMRKESKAAFSVVAAMVLLAIGGLILGPIVQKYAFGAFWTGWPFGDDFTDNKTLFGVLAWLPATLAALRRRPLRWKVILGWIAMMGVFLVPHSFRGSELDWSEIPTE
jgi:hypothetical protein